MPIPGLVENWNFQTDTYPRWKYRKLIETAWRYRSRRPTFLELKPLFPSNIWIVYFLYAPKGSLTASQKFTLRRLHDSKMAVLTIIATEDPGQFDREILDLSSAVYWKALPGYDFSAYTLALELISLKSDGATVLVLNDSVYGPFVELMPLINNAQWELTGLTGSSQDQNHIQSYCFILKNVTKRRLRQMWSIFIPWFCFNAAKDVIFCQELRLARAAAAHMSVGAFWFAEAAKIIDPTLVVPFDLLERGFPFLKKSLLGKHEGFQAREKTLSYLANQQHPVDDVFSR